MTIEQQIAEIEYQIECCENEDQMEELNWQLDDLYMLQEDVA